MNDLMIFSNSRFGEIRAIKRDGEPWFAAADVCRALDIGNVTQTLSRLDADEVTLISNEGRREINFVNEPGLYSLVLGSRKPEAKAFKRWITHEVLPSIRKHGAYIGPETLEDMLTSPDLVIKLLTALKAEQEKNRSMERPPVRRIRTLPQAVKEMREADPDTCVTLNALRCWVKSGAIPSTKAGKNFLVDMDALSLFIAGGVADGKYPKN